MLLLGEAKWSEKIFSRDRVMSEVERLVSKPPPLIAGGHDPDRVLRVLFLPDVAKDAPRKQRGVHIISGPTLLDMPPTAGP
jgi:hypothetical protein